MGREVALFIDDRGHIGTPASAVRLNVYRRQQGVWRLERELPIQLDQVRDLAGMRAAVDGIVSFLAECRVVGAENFQGVILHGLEKAGVGLWEICGEPDDSMLDQLWFGEENDKTGTGKPKEDVYPVLENRGEGRLFISIAGTQRGSGSLTSKQVLYPMINQGNFCQLEILCIHVPPWLEAEARIRGWKFAMQKNERREVLITLSVSQE